MSDPFIKNSLPDYTEEEFVSFIGEIRKEDKASTDDRADELVLHLNKIAGHSGGMDLIYYPELGADTSSAGIVKTIKEWRAANGLPGFKKRAHELKS